MILKHIIYKNFISKTLKNNYSIIDIIIFTKQLTILYITCYSQIMLNNQLLLINNLPFLNSYLKIFKLFTNNPYINNNKISKLLINWKILKEQLLLLKWIVYLITLININKIQLPFNNLIKLFKKFIILKNNYWTIINLKTPYYIFILSRYINTNLCKDYLKINKHIFFITNSPVLSYCKQFNIIPPNIEYFKLILELILTASMQGKYYNFKKT